MKGIAIISKGLEETAAKEIKELTGSDCKSEQGCVIFDFKKLEDLCLLCYKSQSVDRILYLVGKFDFGDFFSCLERFLWDLSIKEWVLPHKTFEVKCIRIGSHDFKSVDVESKASELIQKKNKIKVDMKSPEIIFFFYIIEGKCYFGIDFAGFELNKRGYKIFLHSGSLRGTIAYSLIRESAFEKNEVMLDPFSRDGVIAIEAAFFASGFAQNYYKKDRFAFLKLKIGVNFEKLFLAIDKSAKKPKAKINCFDHQFKYVDYSRKNAKIAGVEKFMDFSRTELEWLDIKFKKATVDRIITNPPVSKNANLEKIYNELFYQSDYILKGDGSIAMITKDTNLLKKQGQKHGFVAAKEKEVWSGEQMLKIIVFKKKTI